MSKQKLLIKMSKKYSDGNKLMIPAVATYFCHYFSQQEFYITQVQNALCQDFKGKHENEACFYRFEKLITPSSSQEVIYDLEKRVIWRDS